MAGQSLNNPVLQTENKSPKRWQLHKFTQNLMGKLKPEVSGSHLCDLPIGAVHRPLTEDAHGTKLKKKM